MSDTTAVPAAEPTHSWLITLQYPIPHGFAVTTQKGTLTVQPGTTRESAYLDIRAWLTQHQPEWADASVLFFSLEPYRL
ncbi:hypothetical protein AB0A71_06355 [Kitasatospora aureofaciens]|uniref:hypothetical protein n=1 Tax=Kitasatospora aureofaciens TaxID=1894 RepID=UPI003401DB28